MTLEIADRKFKRLKDGTILKKYHYTVVCNCHNRHVTSGICQDKNFNSILNRFDEVYCCE